MSPSHTFSDTIRRTWPIPVVLLVLGAGLGVLLAPSATDEIHQSTAVIQLADPTAEGAVQAVTASMRDTASAELGEAGVVWTSGELASSSTVRLVDGVTHVEIVSGRADTLAAANALASAYLSEIETAIATARDERARTLAEQSANLTRDLLAVELTLAEADIDADARARLDGRLLALEVERDRRELEASSTAEVERQLSAVQEQIDQWVPAVDQVEVARATAARALLSQQLADLRTEIADLTSVALPAGAVATSYSDVLQPGSGGVDPATVGLYAVLGAILGFAIVLAFHLVLSARPSAPVPLAEQASVAVSTSGVPVADVTRQASAPDIDAPLAPVVPRPIVGSSNQPGAEVPTAGSETRQELSVIAEIPPVDATAVQPLVLNDPDSAPGVAYAQLSRLLLSSVSGIPTPVLSFVGPGEETGRTTVAVNVAGAAANAGRSTLLISPLWNEIEIPGLPVLPPGLGIGDPDEFPSPSEFRAALDDVSAMVDLVVVDSPAADQSPEIAELAAVTDLSVVVVMTGRSSVTAVGQLEGELHAARARVAGIVVNANPLSVEA